MLNTHEFLNALSAHADAPLHFVHAEFSVPAGFHLTEVKALAIEAMDCGGQAEQWYETHFQLWQPQLQPQAAEQLQSGDASQSLSASKFSQIVERVRPAVPLRHGAQVRVEWGDAGRPAVAYPVSGVHLEGGTLSVHLYSPQVACKANARQTGSCDPAPQELSVLDASACAPGSGCC